jgi:hypothetical protein
VSGIAPLTGTLLTPMSVKMVGSSDAITAPQPMKKVCIAKPAVCCDGPSLSPTKARNGSIDTLMAPSSSHRTATAIHSAVEFGIRNRAMDASKAPMKKNGRRRPQVGCQVLSLR